MIADYVARAPFVGFHARRRRMACIVSHRRAGKTVAAVADLVDKALRCDPASRPAGRFAYVAPYLNQSKDTAWAYLKRYGGDEAGAVVREGELSVDFANGARVRLYGADNPDRLRGLYFDGVVLDEFADFAPGAWSQVIRPTLSDRGGWAAFIGTPKGKNELWRVFERSRAEAGWFSLRLSASGSGIVPAGELAALKAELSEEEYEREFETSFEAAVRGAYYGALLRAAEAEGRITRVAADPLVPVTAAFDLGIGDATAIWLAQFVGREIRLWTTSRIAGWGWTGTAGRCGSGGIGMGR